MTAQDLNMILEDAYAASEEYKAFTNGKLYSEYENDPIFIALWRSSRHEWKKLRDAIEKAVPTRFIGKDRRQKTIGTAGIITADNMLFYSDKLDSQYCMLGYRLDQIRHFL